MTPKLIKTEEEYEETLNRIEELMLTLRIEELMNTKQNTPEMDELELLTFLVAEYEDRIYPIMREE